MGMPSMAAFEHLISQYPSIWVFLEVLGMSSMPAFYLQSHNSPSYRWVFLEVLGVFTLFGVMMVDAYSLRFENTICNLTLYSMSMLVYVLADLDSPFDGFFRVDMNVLLEVVARAEVVYNCARSGKEIDLSYVEL